MSWAGTEEKLTYGLVMVWSFICVDVDMGRNYFKLLQKLLQNYFKTRHNYFETTSDCFQTTSKLFPNYFPNLPTAPKTLQRPCGLVKNSSSCYYMNSLFYSCGPRRVPSERIWLLRRLHVKPARSAAKAASPSRLCEKTRQQLIDKHGLISEGKLLWIVLPKSVLK